ncbi:hypothetical protein PWT90_05444 [Aphanocladium album]|nr:hypothetical protein PWT90_05444 [Aphanocladium album]
MSHSKRNTTRPVFTSHERNLAKANWASKSARLHRDSFLPFGSCGLCLEPARDAVSCQRGDIFCRECALANMLAQKKDMKRAERARRQAELDTAKARADNDDEDQRRAVRDFELTQAGFSSGGASSKVAKGGDEREAEKNDDALRITSGKRKFQLDADELDRIAKEDRAKARKAIDDEKASKSSLPSFWTPSLTPDATKETKFLEASKKVKPVAVCPASASDSPHALTMQHLITIKFDTQSDFSKSANESNNNNKHMCPSCRKVLTNASSPAMGVKCGHVLCLSCVKQFMAPSSKDAADSSSPVLCFVCDTPLAFAADKDAPKTALPSGMIALRSEGTGFSAKGSNTVERTNVAFQC